VTAPLSCAGFKAHVHGYFVGTLDPALRAAVEAHPRVCAPCGAFWTICHELTCRQFVEFLNDYVDGQLPAERAAIFERHLGICADCRNYLESYRRTMQLSVLAMDGGAVPPPPPPELVDAILSALGKRPA